MLRVPVETDPDPTDPTPIDFDDGLRSRLAANLEAHDRRALPLDGRRHAAVALVIVDSDAERDDVEPVPEGAIDMSGVPGGAVGAAGRRLDGRMVGVAGGASFLICRRPIGMRRHAGQWALPGGRLDPGEVPLDGALRELEEEVGLRLGAYDVIGWLDDYATRSGFVISPVVLWGGGDPVLEPDPDEVFAAYRIGLHALRDSSPRLIEIPESTRPVLQVPLGGDLIHAPTGAILFQFREVALLGRPGQRVDHVEEPVFAWR
jgi:ADP-ribose pyrophosphatase YjhB (NUDIX family)